mmetsp:Transcript_1508/g.5713  ORF Transcript_1508/g.5713 Transcript_1508/m.5713 type:complete len:81 (+) Transcript_1508:86-328(+)
MSALCLQFDENVKEIVIGLRESMIRSMVPRVVFQIRSPSSRESKNRLFPSLHGIRNDVNTCDVVIILYESLIHNSHFVKP